MLAKEKEAVPTMLNGAEMLAEPDRTLPPTFWTVIVKLVEEPTGIEPKSNEAGDKEIAAFVFGPPPPLSAVTRG